MRLRKVSFMMIAVMLFCLLAGCGQQGQRAGETAQESAEAPADYDGLMKYWKDQAEAETVSCWYTSETDREWLETVAQEFETGYGVKVKLVYYDGVSLFADMNQANQDGTGPDVYLVGNDQLELAKNSGMAEKNIWLADAFWKENYPEVAKKAVTYQGKQYGYPVYFDTYCLVYDANLLENAPASIDDILAFLDEYEDTGSTKAIFRWDVADPYINTMFLASYADLFGENGDQPSAFLVSNEQTVATMEYFQSLSEYLWMNKKNISHDTVRNRIKDGTLVLGLCKSDILPTLYEMNDRTDKAADSDAADSNDEAEEGNADIDDENTEVTEPEGEAENETDTTDEEDSKEMTNYQISYVPSLTAELSSTTLSTTYAAFVNPYGADNALGNLFGLYLSYACADGQYAGNGRLPVRSPESGMDGMQSIIYAQYLNSQPVPKVMVLGDYLAQSAIAFDAIWSGKDAKEQLDKLQSVMDEKIK